MWAGMEPLFIAITDLMMLAMPEAHSEWPILVLTEPIISGRSTFLPVP